MKRFLIIVLLVLSFPALSWSLATSMELGVRGGVDVGRNLHENYTYGEVYYSQALPWEKELSPSSKVSTRLDVSAGYLGADTTDGGWFAAGGDVVYSVMDGTWEFEVGVRPAWMSEHVYGDDDFGGPFQFFSHAGVTFNLDQFALSYRLQHISNANIYSENPGIELHVIGLGVRF